MNIVSDSEPAPAGLEEVRRLYDQGLFRQAWMALAAAPPRDAGLDPAGEVLLSRLHSQLGLRRASWRIMARLWHRHRSHPAVAHHFAWHLLELRGALHTWAFLQEHPVPPGGTHLHRADYLLQCAEVLGRLRDFERAEGLIAEAAVTAPELRWLPVARGRVLSQMDRHEEALENARAAAALDPGCWHLPLEEAESLIALGRDEEALGCLRHHALRFEAPPIILHWVNLEAELEHWSHALDALDRLEDVIPPLDGRAGNEDLHQWLAARRSGVCWLRGDAEGAAAWAAKAGDADSFHGRFAARIANPPEGARRVVLNVGFTRQRYLTCVPATLATLCRYWGRPAEHLAIAEAICYDGTAGHHARAWAAAHGWCVREFTATPRVARALIDRGAPFVLCTVEPGNAHAQAVIGYDDYRGTLVIRDPYERSKSEIVEEASLKGQAPWGPRAMVIVPPGKQALLDGVPFGDDAAYDLMHELECALERHDRAAAVAATARLQREHPDHRLAILARFAMAAYDQNPGAAAAALAVQLSRHPSDVDAALRRHGWRATDAPRETRLAEWAATLQSPASHPLLWIEYAREIAGDGRRRAECERWLNRASRRLLRSAAVQLRAELLWNSGRFDEALEWYRIASCLEERNEDYAIGYFRCSRVRGRTDEACAWLRLRAERHGGQCSAPVQTLALALADLDRIGESLDVLEEGLRRRPSDIAHRVHTALTLSQAGRVERAREILQESTTGARPSSWHAAMASLDERVKGPAAALADWEEAAESAPLDLSPLEGLLRALEAVHGREAARRRLLARIAQFPHYYPLQRFAAAWMCRVSMRAQEELLTDYLRAEPDDAWAWRELAFARAHQANGTGALEAVARAADIEPAHPAVAVAQAEALLLSGDRQGALAGIRKALRQSIDYPYALRLLLAHCHDAASRRETLQFVRGEIVRQYTNGEALELFTDLAAPHIAWGEILAFLREARAARPDLWRVADSLAKHLARMGHLDEAVATAREGVAAFPLVENLHITLATLLHNAGRRDEERAGIDAALGVNASWAWFHRQRAVLLEDEGQIQAAAGILDPLLQRQPRDALARYLRGCLAWKLEDRAGAVRIFSALVEDEPGYFDAWSALAWVGNQTGDPECALRKARELTARWPDQANLWIALANQLQAPKEFEECCNAYDRALALNPSLVRAVEEKALLLCKGGRIEEALLLVRDARWGEPRSPVLRMREAWILRQVGRNDEAIARLEEALRDDPTLYLARTWAMEWLSADAAVGHAEELTLQYPNDANAWCLLGERRRQTGKHAEARKAFERAQELDPRSRKAFAKLFDCDLSDKLYREAADRIEHIATHLAPVARTGFRMELALAKDDQSAFLKHFQELLESQEEEPVWFGIALDRLTKDRIAWRDRVFNLTLTAIKGPARNPEAVAFAAQLCRHKASKILRVLRARPVGDEMAKRGYVRVLANYGNVRLNKQTSGAARLQLKRLVARRRDWFASDIDLWGQAGYAMLCLGLHRECVGWMQNWRTFPAAQPWMVNNLVISQLKIDDGAGARANVQDLLLRPFYDDTVMRCHLLEAVWLHLEGKREEALRHQALVNPDALDRAFETPILNLANWLATFSAAADGALPVGKNERSDWKALKRQLGSYKALDRDLDQARAMRAKAAGTRLWTWKLGLAPSAQSRQEPSGNAPVLTWIVLVIVIQIARSCAQNVP